MLSLVALLAGCAPRPTLPIPKPWTGGNPPSAAPYATPKDVQAAPAPPTVAPNAQGARVLVVVNSSSAESTRLGKYYADKRGVPRANIVLLTTSTDEEIGQDVFKKDVETPVRAALAANPKIDFLLLVRGVPLRVKEGGYAVDSLLMSPGLSLNTLPKGQGLTSYPYADNPYFGKTEAFSHAKFGIYLACRLDGYTYDDAKALVDRSVAARPGGGPILIDTDPKKHGGGYKAMQDTMVAANDRLTARNVKVQYDVETTFAGPSAPLAGYVSWGSNDEAFSADAYHRLRFVPGAIAETFVSFGGRTFRPTSGGQSLIADLIAQGVTGVKGYVSEPYTLALAHADILFDRYVSGANLAESFYSASMVTHWKDVVIGDPLCAPYRR